MRILFVPHACPYRVLTRTQALARSVAAQYPDEHEVFLWEWVERSGGRVRQVQVELRNLLRRSEFVPGRPGVVRPPTWLARTAVVGTRVRLAQRFNAARMGDLVGRLGLQAVVNASALYIPAPTRRSFRYIYDLVDDHAPHSPPRVRPWVEDFVAREIQVADEAVVVSRGLADEVASKYGRQARVIPNGADLAAIRGLDSSVRRQMRASLGLGDGPALVFVGNHGAHAGLPFLLDVYARFREREPRSSLLVVGPVAPGQVPSSGPGPGVVLTGAVPPETVPRYLAAADLGVLPNVLGSFRDHAFPLKVIEYGAARLPTLAVPLAELRRQSLPWVRFAERELEAWVEGLSAALAAGWNPEWDAAVEVFDWPRLAGLLMEVVAGRSPSR